MMKQLPAERRSIRLEELGGAWLACAPLVHRAGRTLAAAESACALPASLTQLWVLLSRVVVRPQRFSSARKPTIHGAVTLPAQDLDVAPMVVSRVAINVVSILTRLTTALARTKRQATANTLSFGVRLCRITFPRCVQFKAAWVDRTPIKRTIRPSDPALLAIGGTSGTLAVSCEMRDDLEAVAARARAFYPLSSSHVTNLTNLTLGIKHKSCNQKRGRKPVAAFMAASGGYR